MKETFHNMIQTLTMIMPIPQKSNRASIVLPINRGKPGNLYFFGYAQLVLDRNFY